MALQLLFEGDDSGLLTCPNSLRCFACGGRGPYTWTTTKGALSSTNGVEVQLSPPANPGSGEPGDAYYRGKFVHNAGNCVTGCSGTCGGKAFNCNDVATASVITIDSYGGVGSGCAYNFDAPCPPCANCQQYMNTIDFGTITGVTCHPTGEEIVGPPKDVRTQTQKDNGCNPCFLAMYGATVTVTDADGNSVSRGVTVA